MIALDFRQIEYIIGIAEEKSLSRAAQKLFVSHSALSQQLSKLEKELECRLFFRSGNSMTPTEEGEIYLKAARECMAVRQSAYKKIQTMSGRCKEAFTVGMPSNRAHNMFTLLLTQFSRRYPNVSIHLEELPMPELMKLTEEGKVDIMLGSSMPHPPELVEYVIDRECLLLAVSASHPLASRGYRINRQSGSVRAAFPQQYFLGLVKQFYEANRIRSE